MVLNKSSVFNTLIQIFTIHKLSHNQRNGCYHSPNIPSVYFPKYQLHILPYLRFLKKILQPNFLCSDDRMISSDFHIRFFLFTGLLKDKANHDHPKGVSLRWAINADGEGGVQLLLQTLPAPASLLNNRPTFKRDTCPGRTVISFNMSVDIYYNPGTFGPKPILFSTNPEVTNQVLATSSSAHHNIFKGILEYDIHNSHSHT